MTFWMCGVQGLGEFFQVGNFADSQFLGVFFAHHQIIAVVKT
jgi:hypothetical protein